MRFTRFALMALTVVFALVGMSAWVVAKGPVASFPDRIQFAPTESPEGVAVDKVGNVYVSIAVGLGAAQHDEIWKFTPSGEMSVLTRFLTPGLGRVGLAVDATGNVYIARALPVSDPGVYQVDKNGQAILMPGTEQIYFADGLAFDQRGNLYITEMTSYENPIAACFPSGEGRIWRVPKGGTAEIWLRDPLLNGNCLGGLGVAVGANGIQFYRGDLYLINTEHGTVVRVPVQSDGTPGTPEVWATLQPVQGSLFTQMGFPAMGDGFALDVHGNAYVAVVSQSAIVRINADDMSQETLAMFPLAPLDTPTSVAFGTGKGGRESVFIVSMGWLYLYGVPDPPGTSLMKFDVGIPGLPLP
jgi:sugar lactone lactonase YvrE